MKTLKQLKEEYNNFITQIISEEVMLEASQEKKNPAVRKLSTVPSTSQMPNLLLFRRISYKRYPDNQVIALYYSKSVDKYLSIPFGPTGNLNLSESTIYDTLEELELSEGAKWEAVKGGVKGAIQGAAKGFFKGNAIAAEPGMTIGAVVGGVHGAYKGAKNAYQRAKAKKNMEEDWQSVNRKDKTDGLSQKAVNAYRRENPGSKLQTAVTEKNPTGKRAARRKAFCSRMGGMKKRLTSAKTARDPDSNINKALRRWNCEEDFKMKLNMLREQAYGKTDAALDAASFIPGPAGSAASLASAYRSYKRGDKLGAALDVAGALPGVGYLAKGAKVAKAVKAGKTAAKLEKGAAKTATRARKAPPSSTIAKPSKLGAVADMARSAVDAVTGGNAGPSDAITRLTSDRFEKAKAKVYSPSVSSSGESAIDNSRRNTVMRKEYESSRKQVSENKMSDLRQMIDEGRDIMNIGISGRTITLNTGMAKRILEVYDSVNSKNKKIVENMLNEDLESFKRLLTFSIRN